MAKNNKKNTKKNVKAKATKAVVEETTKAVEAVVEAAVATTTSKAVKKQTGGGKAKKTTSASPKTVASKTAATKTATKTTVKKQAGGAKAPVKAAAKSSVKTTKKTETVIEESTTTESGDRKQRSFKVRLPGSETFEGRFTGLTPYQAANKALSKYYREVEKPETEILFSIRESTRGSKRGTYSYNGRREKLDIPVEYKIDDGRVITKNYKNRLTKIKKAELETLNISA